MRAAVGLLAIALTVAGVGCGRSSTPPADVKKEAPEDGGAPHTDEAKHDELPRRVHLPADVVAAARIRTASVARGPLGATMTLAGEVVADPDRTARVSAPAAGRLVRVGFKEGAKVAKGDVLGAVRVTDIAKVRAAYAGAATRAASARANADRISGLADKGMAATQEAVASRSEALALAAEARGLDEQLRALGLARSGEGSEIPLRAAVDGVVVARDAVVGQPVSAEQVIGTIADLSEVWFLARVFEKDLGKLQTGSKAEIELNAYPSERFEGVVEQIGSQLDPLARTVTARIRLENRGDRLRIGLFGSARVAVGGDAGGKSAVVVPRGAVTDVGGRPVVFVRQADDDYELHEVVLGEAALGKIQVLSGLREGEQVVTDGAFTLKSVVLKSTLGEED